MDKENIELDRNCLYMIHYNGYKQGCVMNITCDELKHSFSSTSHFICLPFGLSNEKPGSIRLIGTLSLLCTCELGNQPHSPLHSPSDHPFGDTYKDKFLVIKIQNHKNL